MDLVAPHATLAVAAPPNNQQNVNSWQMATKHGTQSGVGVSVSGSGAWAKLLGDMQFSLRYLEQSQTFDQLKSQQSISSGVGGFWAWLGLAENRSSYQEQIHQAFHEMSTAQAVTGSAHFDLDVTGQYPNVQVDASAFVLVLQIRNDSGNTFNLVSSSGGAGDTGAQDQNGNTLPTKNNNSTISI